MSEDFKLPEKAGNHRDPIREIDDLYGHFGTVREEIGKRILEVEGLIAKPGIRGGFEVDDVRSYGTIQNAVNAVPSASSKTIYITNTQTIAANLTIPSNISVVVLKGGSFSISSGVTLTINGAFQAGIFQVFSGAGSVAGLRYAVPEWWGIDGTDDYVQMQAAANALTNGGILQLEGAYNVGAGDVILLANTWVRGRGLGKTVITGRGAGEYTFYSTDKDNIQLTGFKHTGASLYNISGGSTITLCDLYVDCTGISTANGVTARGVAHLTVDRSTFLNVYNAVYLDSKPTGAPGTYTTFAKVTNCHFEMTEWLSAHSYPTGVYVFYANGTIVSGCTFKNIYPGSVVADRQGYGVYEGDGLCDSVQVSNCRFIAPGSVMANGVLFSSGDSGIVNGCVFDGDFRAIDGGMKNTVIANNTFKNAYVSTQRHAAYTGFNSLLVKGNIFLDAGRAPLIVQIEDVNAILSNAHIEGNFFSGAAKGAMWIRHVEFASVINNIIIDCNTDNDSNDFYRGGINYFGCSAGYVDGNRVENTNGGLGRMNYGVVSGASTHSIFTTGNNLFQNMTIGGVLRPVNTSTLKAGTTIEVGTQRHNWSPGTGSSPGSICTTAGTVSTATDSTGDTDGSTATITGMTDTSDFYVGNYVSVSAGFPTTGPYKILSKTSTSITISTNSDSVQSNITVSCPAPVFQDLPRTGIFNDANSWGALQTFQAGIVVSGGSAFAAGKFFKDADYGLFITGITGTTSDFLLTTPSGGTLLQNPTGTTDLQLGGATDFILDTTTGTKMGTATNQKFALWNQTPIIQPAHANQAAVAAQTQDSLTDSTTGTADTTLADVGAAFSQATLNNNFADIAAQLAKIRTDIAAIKTFQDQNRTDQIAVGVIKGAA